MTAITSNAPAAIKTFQFVDLVTVGVELPARAEMLRSVPRPMTASVVCGRMLVSVSLDEEPSRTVLASPLFADVSFINGVPSARQNASASSASMRLHWGQRFMNQFVQLWGNGVSTTSQ